MKTVFSLWWDDEEGSTHLHKTPFYSRTDAVNQAARYNATIFEVMEVKPNEVQYFFPEHSVEVRVLTRDEISAIYALSKRHMERAND